MNLLGLDLASRLSGWCAGDGAQVPECGAWAFPELTDEDGATDYGLMLATLFDYLEVAFDRFRPAAVAYESPLLITRGRRGADPLQERTFGDTLHKLRLLYPLGPFVEWYCRRAGTPCHELTVPEVKSEVTNNRFADKEDIAQLAERCGLILPATGRTDASDAWAVWKGLLRSYSPAISAEWDGKIRIQRGELL